VTGISLPRLSIEISTESFQHNVILSTSNGRVALQQGKHRNPLASMFPTR
jgi:hypothetical protein